MTDRQATPTEGWGRALSKAAVALGASLVGLVVIPNTLISYLSLRVSPLVRDVSVAAWLTICVALLSVLFVRLQPKLGGGR